MEGLYQVIEDHKKVFENLVNPPIILNELKLDLNTRQGRDSLSSYLTMTFTSENLPHIPTCALGHIGGEPRLGEICDICGTRVAHVVDRQLEDCLWLAPPEGVTAFIHPEIWSCIDKATAPEKNYSLLAWMTDPNKRDLPSKHGAWFEEYTKTFKRGINYYHDHFDVIMEAVLNAPWMTDEKNRMELWEFIIVHRDMIFQKHLPIPSSVFVVSEKSSRGSLADDITPALLNAIFTITSTYSSPIKLNQKARESHASRGSQSFAKCYADIASGYIGSKPGLIRRQWIGSRQFFTGRAVVTSINGTYHHEEVHLPWAMAANIFEPMLVNLLMKRGYLEDEALAFIEDHTLTDDEQGTMRQLFDVLLELCAPIPGWDVSPDFANIEDIFNSGEVPEFFPTGIFKDLDVRHVDKRPMRGYSCLIHRPPTLTRLSIQNLYITKIKEPEDWSMGVPDSGLVGWNGDFDGDEFHVLLSIDQDMAEPMSRLRQHLGVRSLRRPRQLSEFQRIHAPLAATFMNAVHGSEEVE